MPTDIELLARLRDVGQRRDGEQYEEAIDAILSRLPDATMMRLAHQEVARRLPLFERHHPDMGWPRVWLDALASGEPFTFDESTPEVLEEAPGPGGNNFAEAVRLLALAAAAEGKQRVVHARDAILDAIMAEMVETAGSAHRELWDRQFQAWLNGEPGLHSYEFTKAMNDPRAIAVNLAAWTRLADELAAALGVTG